MIDDQRPDLSEKWAARLERVQRSHARSDVRGMARPPRDPGEREFLRRISRDGPYQEVTVTDLLKEAIARDHRT